MDDTKILEIEKRRTRKLTARDVFPMVKIINEIGFGEFKAVLNRPDVSAAMVEAADGDASAIQKVGMAVVFDMVGVVIANLEKAEGDIFAFVASVAGMGAEEVGDLPLDEFMGLIVEIVRAPEFKDFFKAAARLLK